MRVQRYDIEGPALLISPVYSDARGAFLEAYNHDAVTAALGYDPGFMQDNVSRSTHVSTLRGLHLQKLPHAQGKLVRCLAGRILDVIIDVRPGSSSFGKHISVDLCAEDGRALWVPVGFLHGFITQSPETIVTYKVTHTYDKDSDISVSWNDPDLAIDWGNTSGGPILSEKDSTGISFRDYAASVRAAS